MCCTDIVRPEYTFDGTEWREIDADLPTAINKYNRSAARFLFWPWGVFVCAFARRNLWAGGILAAGESYLYSDTDSIKITHGDSFAGFAAIYNEWIGKRLRRALDFHGLPESLIEPVDSNGKKKKLGIWEFDGHFRRFKTVGAKRYLVEYSDDARNGDKRGKIELTVSGLGKRSVQYLSDEFGRDGAFEHFSEDL